MTKKIFAVLLLMILCIVVVSYADDNETNDSFGDNETDDINCTDGIMNGDEIGIDCGGSCSVCVDDSDDNETETPDDELNDDDEEELDEFDNNYGATMRLLQLEKNIYRNAMIGDAVVEVIEANHPDFDTTDLLLILGDLNDLLEDVQRLAADEDLTVLAQEFVAIKKESITLTQEFRKASKDILTATDKQEIRGLVKDLKENLSGYDKQINNSRQMHNANRVARMLQNMGAANPELVEQIQNGNATLAKVRKELREEFKNLSLKEKVQAVKNVKSEAVRKIQQKKEIYKAVKDELPDKVKERVKDRVTARLDRASDKAALRSEAAERKANRLSEVGRDQAAKRMDQVSERFEKTAERLDDRADKLRGNQK